VSDDEDNDPSKSKVRRVIDKFGLEPVEILYGQILPLITE
jgi:hypothetical protein